jgi:hypothetical protein
MISQIRPLCSLVYGVALAAPLAGFLATSLKLNMFILEGVSILVISTFKCPSQIMDRQLEHAIKDTITSFLSSSLWEARNINRNANFYAHYEAYWAAARIFLGCIPSLVSPLALSPFVVEKIHLPFPPSLEVFAVLFGFWFMYWF